MARFRQAVTISSILFRLPRKPTLPLPTRLVAACLVADFVARHLFVADFAARCVSGLAAVRTLIFCHLLCFAACRVSGFAARHDSDLWLVIIVLQILLLAVFLGIAARRIDNFYSRHCVADCAACRVSGS